MRSSDTVSDILAVLADNKLHTMSEIARKVEVSRQTINKYVTSLSYRHNIKTFEGARKGGVRLISELKIQTDYLNKEEFKKIVDVLSTIENPSISIQRFINSLASQFEVKEQEEYEFKREQCYGRKI